MARRSLPTLAAAAQKALARGADTMSGRGRRDVGVFARAVGVSEETFLGYSARTRAQYIQAAKHGRTAKEERERVQTRRKERVRVRTEIRGDARWARILELRTELLAEGIRVIAGPLTGMDRLKYENLYSDDSLQAHVITYGFDYVVRRMEAQYRALREYNQSGGLKRETGRNNMMVKFGTVAVREFAASDAVEDDDERWYWYHASTVYM
jgi:hypothetical protein